MSVRSDRSRLDPYAYPSLYASLFWVQVALAASAHHVDGLAPFELTRRPRGWAWPGAVLVDLGWPLAVPLDSSIVSGLRIATRAVLVVATDRSAVGHRREPFPLTRP